MVIDMAIDMVIEGSAGFEANDLSIFKAIIFKS